MIEILGLIATITSTLALVFLAVSVALYFAFHIPEVRDELSGNKTEREIMMLRKNHSYFHAASERLSRRSQANHTEETMTMRFANTTREDDEFATGSMDTDSKLHHTTSSLHHIGDSSITYSDDAQDHKTVLPKEMNNDKQESSYDK